VTQQLRTALVALILSVSIAAATGAVADEAAPRNAAFSMPAPDEVVNIMAAKLALSDDQRAHLTPLIAERQQKMKAILADTGSRPMARRRQAKDVMTDTDRRINAILSPDQQQKYAELEEQMKEQLKQRMQDGRGAAAN